ncbi:MAG: DNA polymerase III subunit beta [Elusimicrobiales bacterium]|nr:DNA polymerase III subunit beta [Elusimicrobiales bacterium]
MKITSTKENLLEGMQIVQAAVSTRTTLAILHNFLMEAADSRIKIVRTDLEMATTHYINAEVVEPGSVTIPAKEFTDILHLLPGDNEITIYSDSGNKVHIICGKSKFWLMGAPKEEYPLVPDMGKSDLIELPAALIQNMVQKTIFAASVQETRYVLNGILWMSGKEGLEMVATDGRRLALARSAETKAGKEFKIIVPTKVLHEFLRFLSINKPEEKEAVTIGIATNQIGFQMRQTTLISRLIEGNFPNYEQVIPSKRDIVFEIENGPLLEVTRRAALCAGDRGAVKYQMKTGVLAVTAVSPRMEFQDEIKTGYSGADFHVSFNPQYVIDVLKNMPAQKVAVGMTNSLNPVVLEPAGAADSRYVIMPVRS